MNTNEITCPTCDNPMVRPIFSRAYLCPHCEGAPSPTGVDLCGTCQQWKPDRPNWERPLYSKFICEECEAANLKLKQDAETAPTVSQEENQ